MTLLLLLSAMLSALSGAGAGARTPQAPVAVNAVATVAAATVASKAVVAGRPAQSAPSRVDTTRGVARTVWQLAPTAPLYLSRRRE